MNGIVGSLNPMKSQVIKIAYKRVYGQDAIIHGTAAPSGVGAQPLTARETYQGADNRLVHIMREHPDADFWATLEGGIEERAYGMVCFGFVLIRHRYSSLLGIGKTGEMILPRPIAAMVREGMELGKATDQYFDVEAAAQHQGCVGLLTENLVTRTCFFTQAAIVALCQLRNLEWYQ